MPAGQLAWLAAAGAAGTLARALLTRLVQSWLPEGFPWGTLVVNMTGCFLFGLVWALGEGKLRISPETRFLILTGFMGAFTTFSSYVFEVGLLGGEGRTLVALGNIAFQNVVGLLLLFAGLALGKHL